MSSPADPLADQLRSKPSWHALALGAGIVIAPLIAIVALVTLADATQPYSPLPPPLHRAVVGLPTVLVVYEGGRRYVLRAPASRFRVVRPGRQVTPWAVAGILFAASVLGLQLGWLGASRVGGLPAPGTAFGYLVSSLAAGLLAGVLEELAFRGALLRLVEARWGPRPAIGVSAAIFASLHQGHASSHLELVLVVAAMFAAGLLLGVVVVRTGNVWNAVAVHAGWNSVFGGQIVTVAPPTQTPGAAILRFGLPTSSPVLTGGEASLGASPLTTALLLVGAVAVARYAGPRSIRVGSTAAPIEPERRR